LPDGLSAKWVWPDSIGPAAWSRMAKVTRVLLKEPERWIHRRVERIYFKDHQIAHHQISVDFSLPVGLPAVSRRDNKGVYIAPLFLLAKDSIKPLLEGKRPRRRFVFFGKRGKSAGRPIPFAPYSNLDLTDHTGQRLPLLTRFQSGLLAEVILLEEAKRVLGKPVPEDVRNEISKISYHARSELKGVLASLMTERHACCDPRHRLRKEKEFSELVYMLANYSIIACLITNPPRRLIYRLAFDELLNEGFSTKKGRIRRSLGWKSEQYAIPLSEIGAGASYHVEIAVPKELLINAVNLVGKRYERFDDLLNKKNRDYSIQQIGTAGEGKIYIPKPLPGRRMGFTWVKLRVRRTGFLVAALITSIVITLMLTAAAFVVPVVIRDSQSESATAVLLLIPALVAVYIGRPGEHPITAKMLRWARVALVVDAVLPVVAVFFLVATPDQHKVKLWKAGSFELGHASLPWLILAGFSVVFIVLFGVGHVIPRPHGENVYKPLPKQ
jgi:hypothetical protein